MKRSRHMNIRYFFLTDQVDSKRVKIEHCPTAEMLADYFTKPLQGLQFRKLRDRIMNIAPSSSTYHSNHLGHRSVLKIKSPSLVPALRMTSASVPRWRDCTKRFFWVRRQ
jgi:hypothetical protein